MSSVASINVASDGCTADSRTSRARMPSSARAYVICSIDGRRPGEPNTRCTPAAIPQPSTTAATAAFGSADPGYIAPIAVVTTSAQPILRVGRARYGAAAHTTAATTARRVAGNDGEPSPMRTVTCTASPTPEPDVIAPISRASTQARPPASARSRANLHRRPTIAASTTIITAQSVSNA